MLSKQITSDYFTKGRNTMSEFKAPEGWSTGYHDRYYTKIIKSKNATIEINRPILTEEERQKREESVILTMTAIARKMALQEKSPAEQKL